MFPLVNWLQPKKIISDKAWELTINNCLSIDIVKQAMQYKFVFNTDVTHGHYQLDSRAQYYSEYLLKYVKRNLGRSTLFYGPPGTGKSNLIKAVSNSLKMKTIRLHNINYKTNQAIVDVIDFFNPDAIVLEDIDHLYVNDVGILLEALEKLNASGKFILASANEIKKINSAFLRPGRFDELIEIWKLDFDTVRKLVNYDQEIFNLVKEYPIAFIKEVMKRVETHGKEQALSQINDIIKRVEKLNTCPDYKI